MKSEITKASRPWDERCLAMREDLESGAYDWLFFKILVNRLDASKACDYERLNILKTMEQEIRKGNIEPIHPLLESLEVL